MSRSKMFETIGNIIRQIGTIPIILISFIYIVIPFLLPEVVKLLGKDALPKELYYAIIFIVFGGIMLFVFPCIVFLNRNIDRKLAMDELNGIIESFKTYKNIADEIKTFPMVKELKLINNKEEFFNDLSIERLHASRNKNSEIRLMNFARTIREQKDEKNAKKYYEDEMQFYNDNNNVKLFKFFKFIQKINSKSVIHLQKMLKIKN